MRKFTRRELLGGTVGAAAVFAGCSESSSTSSGGFTETSVEGQQLVVEFEESLEAETISVIDPNGEAFAETTVTTGASRVTFDISMPYAPGEYRLVATGGDERLAETTQMIRPDLEIVDVGVGANRMGEMPDSLGTSKEKEAIVVVENSGSGPEMISRMQFLGDIPNPMQLEDGRIGIFDPKSGARRFNPVVLDGNSRKTLFTSTQPFSFEGDGIDCSSIPQQERSMSLEVEGEISERTSVNYTINYTASESYDGCDISLSEVS